MIKSNFVEKIFSLKNVELNGVYYKRLFCLGLTLKIKNPLLTISKNTSFTKELLTQGFLKSEFEIERCNAFYEEMKSFDIINKYKALIKNLDKDSIEEISKILGRVIKIATSNTKLLDIFMPHEILKIQEVKKELEANLVKLSKNCYAYKDYFLPINHFESSVFYYKHNIDSINQKNFSEKNIIDAGAYIGDSAIVLEKYTNKNVYSFEPTTENYNLLLETIALNNSTKIIPIKSALGSCEEELEIYLQESGSSINRIINNAPNKEIIKVTSLDKFIDENKLDVGLIKVDIEGFEQEFLKGAEKTIRTQKPTLLISIYHNASDFFDIKPLLESWNLGYKFKIKKPIDGGIRGEVLLIAEQ